MGMPLVNEDVSVLTRKFDETIQEFEESLESWDQVTQLATVEQQNDSHVHQHHALESESVAEMIVSIGQTIAEIGDYIDNLDPSNIRNDELELFASAKANEPTEEEDNATSSNDTEQDEDDDDEDIYNSGEILDERATEKSTGTHLEENETDLIATLSTKVNEISLSIDDSEPLTEQIDTKGADLPDGLTLDVDDAGVDDDDGDKLHSTCESMSVYHDASERSLDEIDSGRVLTSLLGATSDPGGCQSMPSSGSNSDSVTMTTEVNDSTRFLSCPVLQPEKDLDRCMCGKESGFDELRNEEGTLVGVQCRSCSGDWLTAEAAPRSNSIKITWEGRKFYLNTPIRLNTTKLDRSPVSSISELRRGDHIMFNRLRAYFHHAIVVGVTSSGVKVMHWQNKGLPIVPRIVYETKSAEELEGISKVVYAKEDPVELVIARAARAKVHGGEGYHFLENNCESLATYCKTGHYVSLEGKVLRKFFPGIIDVFEYFYGR